MTPKKVNGKWVTGVKPFTLKQQAIIYSLMAPWVVFTLYLIIRAAICSCLYLVGGQGILLFMIFAFVGWWTMLMYRKQERKNFTYKDDDKI